MKKLEELHFNNTYAKLGDAYFSRVLPTPAPAPYLVAFNESAAALIDLSPKEAARPEFIQYFSGQKLLPGSDPLAMVYSGHQFGVRVPRLGDGRAILLGEVQSEAGEGWDLHLKGSGLTPYSRMGDGLAVLRSSIREYLCGEAMHGLGIPTTRTLCIVGSDEKVIRETPETRAIITRMAPTHVRFGSFEYFSSKKEKLVLLADYVIAKHFPEIEKSFPPGPERYGAWLKEVGERTARLIAQWQAVGFAHGVMNTDNMSILGFTLDYGPFGFMDEFEPGFIPNHSDDQGRYSFGQQPSVGLWNLRVLAEALLPLTDQVHSYAITAFEAYQATFHEEQLRLLRAKLGLEQKQETDPILLGALYQVMSQGRVDHTIFFRTLSKFSSEEPLLRAMFEDEGARQSWDAWSVKYRERLQSEGSDDRERALRMNRVNPKYVLRNYMAQVAIDEAVNKKTYTEISRLLKILHQPFEEHPLEEAYAQKPPAWAKHLSVSCSS